MIERLRLLIVGGYGTFGGRLARLLADESRLTLLVAGRSAGKAARFCDSLGGVAERAPASFDRSGDLAAQLAALAPDVVVDASGPFQAYGSDPYRLVRACLAARISYLDLADGSDFVAGIDQFDAEAKRQGVFVLSGVSSFPVLTAAVVRHLARDFGQVEAIAGGIAPSPYAGVGLNVIRAIAAYAGQPVRLWRDGRWVTSHPLTETVRYTVAPPGRLPLPSTLFSLVDVPDLTLVPALRPEVRSVWMGAGPVPEVLHRALIGLAWLVRLRVLPSLTALAPLFLAAVNRLRWGEHRGGMFVELTGADRSGERLTASWHMLAEGDDGPLIPSMAVEAIVRARLDGKGPARGARSAIAALELADYDRVFSNRRITTGFRRDTAATRGLPLYQRILGDAWDHLPAAVRTMHAMRGSAIAEGRASVERASSPLARLVAAFVRLPPKASDVPVSVTFERTCAGETWRRRFGHHAFESAHSARGGRWQTLLVERFGPLSFGLGLIVDEGRLHFVVRRWAFLSLPLPLWLAPVSLSFETEVDGLFHFDVELRHPLLGRIVRYTGWLADPVSTAPLP